MAEHPPTSPPPYATPVDIDLYCLKCGYNLRGLSGDPRRCPECGHLNPMGDLEIPAALISAQLRRMETEPAVCVAATMATGMFLFLLAFIIAADQGRTEPAGLICLGIPSAGSIVAWICCALKFRTSCLGKPGWTGALWQYHVYAIALSMIVLALMAIPMVLFGDKGLARGGIDQLVFVGSIVLGLGAALAFIALAGRRVHRRLKAVLEPLQREVAVVIARDVLRRRLTRHRNW